MTLELNYITSVAVKFDCHTSTAYEIQQWVELHGGQAKVELDSKDDEYAVVLILSNKGAWVPVFNPGWIVREPSGDHKFYTDRSFRARFGRGSWRLQ